MNIYGINLTDIEFAWIYCVTNIGWGLLFYYGIKKILGNLKKVYNE